MKKIFNIISLFAIAAITLVSCQKEQEKHEPGPADVTGCYGVYFPAQEASGSHVYSPVEDPSVDIIVKRTNPVGAIVVPVKATYSEDGIFTMSEVSFADGADETTFTVRFDNAAEGNNYSASFTIEDNNYASLYNSNPISLDFSVMRVEMKQFKTEDGSAVAKITCTDNVFWGEVHDEITIQYYEVDGIRYCETIGGKLKSPADGTVGEGPWGTGRQIKFKWYTKKTVTVNDTDYQFVEVEPNYIGYDSANGPVYMGDYYWMRSDMGLSNGSYTSSYDRYVNAGDGYLPSYYDGHGGFMFHSAYWIHGTTSWYGYKDECPSAIAEGYLRVDYSFELDTDFSSEGVTPVFVEVGADVASIKYALYEGELTATQIANKEAAIIDGTDESVTFSEFDEDGNATLLLSPEKTGLYTFLAVAYDNGGKEGKPAAQSSANIVINHVAAEDVDEYAVKISVGTEDVPARYVDYDNSTAFAYYILGKDVTEAHVAVLETAAYQKAVEKTNATIKADSKYALSAAALAELSKPGGYFSLAVGLQPLTSYTVVVWATNGDLETVVTAEHTTSGLPNEVINEGTGVFTYTNFFADVDEETEEIIPVDAEGLNLEFNPNTKSYEIPHWGDYDVTFSFTVNADSTVDLPIQPIGLSVDGYGTFYVTDYAHIDTFFGQEGVAEYFGLDPKDCGYLDEDGNYQFITVYVCTGGYAWFNKYVETFYPEGKPAGEPAVAALSSYEKVYVGKTVEDNFGIRSIHVKDVERNPQPVKVSASVDYTRKSASEKAFMNQKLTDVR